MIRKLGAALLCMALGTTLYARDDITTSKLFVGLELEGTKVDSTVELFDGNIVYFPKLKDTSDSVIEYGVRLGAAKEDWRTTLLYTYYNNDDAGFDETMHKGSLLLDYALWNTGSSSYTIEPYVGAHIGYMSYALSGDIGNGVSLDLGSDTGLFYGGQAGIALTISEVVQLDLSYKYSLTNLDNIDTPFPPGVITAGGDPITNAVTSIDSMGSVAFSINYFYK
jgi:opacity protein-like surface antigen